ncbi:hypothetical protein [Candidatus Caldatribacterium sp.]|uniref:hypothetical protein n=1 Tax=Candidatus Caldatribacterium sp. TaxID=2282143 RepID=UPI003841F5EC|nr:hypothetical protein [Candidatus Caldatribacterium sp.]
MDKRKDKTYFANLVEEILRWLSEHRHQGITPSKDEYVEWEGKLLLASMIIRDCLDSTTPRSKGG